MNVYFTSHNKISDFVFDVDEDSASNYESIDDEKETTPTASEAVPAAKAAKPKKGRKKFVPKSSEDESEERKRGTQLEATEEKYHRTYINRCNFHHTLTPYMYM